MPKKTAAERFSDRASHSLPVMRLLTSVLVVGRLGERFDEQEAIDAIMMTNVRQSVAENQAGEWLDRALDDVMIIVDDEDSDFPYMVVADPAGGELSPHAWWSGVTDKQLESIQDKVDETVKRTPKKKHTFSALMHRIQQSSESLPYRRVVPEDVRAALESAEKTQSAKTKKKHASSVTTSESAAREPSEGSSAPLNNDAQASTAAVVAGVNDPVKQLLSRLTTAARKDEAPSVVESSEFESYNDYEEANNDGFLFSEPDKQNATNRAATAKRLEPQQSEPSTGHQLAQMLAYYAQQNQIDCGPAGFVSDDKHMHFFAMKSKVQGLNAEEMRIAVKMMTVYSSGPVMKSNARVVEQLARNGFIVVEENKWRRS